MKARIPNQGGQSRQAMLEKIQQMQEEMSAAQEQLEQAEYTASAGGGAVEVVVTGKHEVRSLRIKPEVVDPEDVEMLEDLVTAALNEAMSKADETMEREMEKFSGGMNIPGLPQGLF